MAPLTIPFASTLPGAEKRKSTQWSTRAVVSGLTATHLLQDQWSTTRDTVAGLLLPTSVAQVNALCARVQRQGCGIAEALTVVGPSEKCSVPSYICSPVAARGRPARRGDAWSAASPRWGEKSAENIDQPPKQVPMMSRRRSSRKVQTASKGAREAWCCGHAARRRRREERREQCGGLSGRARTASRECHPLFLPCSMRQVALRLQPQRCVPIALGPTPLAPVLPPFDE